MRLNLANLDEATLRKIATVMEKYKLPWAKVTGTRGMTLAGIPAEQYDTICQELGLASQQPTGAKHLIQSCPGNQGCTKGLADVQGLAAMLGKKLSPLSPPGKVKIAISGCAHCCMQSMVRDIGFFARETGWTVTAGGMTGGVKPRIADIIAQGLQPMQAVELAEKILQVYITEGQGRERIGKTIERLSVSHFKRLVNND